jgi:histidinol dehydrogenase
MKTDFILDRIEAGIKKTNALIVEDIIENVKKFGISPVLALNGKLQNLCNENIEVAEIKNLAKIIKKFGHKEEDFLFFAVKNSKLSKDNSNITVGSIISIYKKSGKILQFSAKENQNWVEAFKLSLAAKKFN